MNSWILCWIKEVIPTRDIPYESIYIKFKIMGTITRRTKLRVPWETERRTMIEKGIEGVWSVAGNIAFLDQGGGYLIQFSRSVMSNSLRLYEPQHVRPPCPSPTPGVYSNPCPLSRWCHLIFCRPLFLLPSIFPSIRVFSNESALRMRWPKYWSFSFSISPSNEHLGLIFRMDWLDLLAFQGTLKSLLQHHCSNASILQCSAFFTVQLSHPYMTTGKTTALTRQIVYVKIHYNLDT